MPVLRSAEERRPNTQFEGFLLGSNQITELVGGEPDVVPDRPNMVVRRAVRGRPRKTGASQPLDQPAANIVPNTEAEAAITEENHNGGIPNEDNEVSDSIVAMGLANDDLTSYLKSLRTTVMALFSILTTGQIRRLKEQHVEEQDQLLKSMIDHTDSCLLARAATQRGEVDNASSINGSRQQHEDAGARDIDAAAALQAGRRTQAASTADRSAVSMTTVPNSVTSPRTPTTITTTPPAAAPAGGEAPATTTTTDDARTEIERRVAEQRRADDDRRAAQQREFERRDAEKRKFNVIIHGVHETDQRGDKDEVYQMLSHLHCGNRYYQIENSYRLGRRHFRKTRMLLITFTNKAAVREVLEKGPRLGRSNLFRNVFIREDIPVALRQVSGQNSRLSHT